MAEEYARLDLQQDVPIAGGTSREIVVYRPRAKDLLPLVGLRARDQLEHFVASCCRAVNGGNTVAFKATELEASDAAEISDCAASLGKDVLGFELSPENGDGVTSPLFYTLREKVTLRRGEEDPEPINITQISFQARRLGEISEFLDAPAGSAEEFRAFMRTFGTLVGVNLPMTDLVIDNLDYTDYLIIRSRIMGKLVRSRGRWKKTSTI